MANNFLTFLEAYTVELKASIDADPDAYTLALKKYSPEELALVMTLSLKQRQAHLSDTVKRTAKLLGIKPNDIAISVYLHL